MEKRFFRVVSVKLTETSLKILSPTVTTACYFEPCLDDHCNDQIFLVLTVFSYSGLTFLGLLTDWGGGGESLPPPPKICHKYPTMMKLGTFIPDLKKTINKSYINIKIIDTSLDMVSSQDLWALSLTWANPPSSCSSICKHSGDIGLKSLKKSELSSYWQMHIDTTFATYILLTYHLFLIPKVLYKQQHCLTKQNAYINSTTKY